MEQTEKIKENPFPIRLGELRTELEKEAYNKGQNLTDYLKAIISNRANLKINESAEMEKLKNQKTKLIGLLNEAHKMLTNWGESTKKIEFFENEN